VADWKFHCDVLCISESASPAEIKAAFRKLAHRFHPDHGGTKEKFQRINNSYKYLLRNAASRPPPSARTAPPPPPGSAPKPPRPRAPSASADTFVSTVKNLKLRARQFFREHRAAIFAALPATTAGLAALISLTVFFTQSPSAELGRENSAELAASATRDELGRARGRCEMLAFEHGNLRDKSNTNFSEWDCDLACNHWTSSHEALEGQCSWNGNTFRRHAANQNAIPARSIASVITAAPPAPAPKPGLLANGFYEDPQAQVEFRNNELPDNVGPEVPFVHQEVKVSEEIHLDSPVAPIVWVSDSHLLLTATGGSQHRFTLSPTAPGEVTVVITDRLRQPIEKLLITIR
jgi:hypothetical protein